MLALDCEPTATPFATVTVAPVPKAVPLVAAVVVEASGPIAMESVASAPLLDLFPAKSDLIEIYLDKVFSAIAYN